MGLNTSNNDLPNCPPEPSNTDDEGDDLSCAEDCVYFCDGIVAEKKFDTDNRVNEGAAVQHEAPDESSRGLAFGIYGTEKTYL